MRDSANSASAERPKVIYVLGAHRSGSTVLGVALGNCENIFFAGELHSWLTWRGVPRLGGEEGAQLWSTVREDVNGAAELFGHQTELYVDRTSALRRLHKWPTIRRRLLKRYRRLTEDLYLAIARATGASHIVDTSHYPLRALQLKKLSGIDLYLLFLVRDPQGVVASLHPRDTTSGSKPPLTTNLHLWATYLLSSLAFLRHPRDRRMFVRHEDFLADPEGMLRQILDRTGSPADVPDLTSLKTGHPLHGNRFLREKDVITLKGPSPRGAPSSRMTTLLQLPWAPVLSRLRPAVKPLASRKPLPPSEGG
jgi:hypothetical protein